VILTHLVLFEFFPGAGGAAAAPTYRKLVTVSVVVRVTQVCSWLAACLLGGLSR